VEGLAQVLCRQHRLIEVAIEGAEISVGDGKPRVELDGALE